MRISGPCNPVIAPAFGDRAGGLRFWGGFAAGKGGRTAAGGGP